MHHPKDMIIQVIVIISPYLSCIQIMLSDSVFEFACDDDMIKQN